jgi:hypothetical protein
MSVHCFESLVAGCNVLIMCAEQSLNTDGLLRSVNLPSIFMQKEVYFCLGELRLLCQDINKM